MTKTKGNIIYAELSTITNERTGVVNDMTKILYTLEMENTERHVGNAILESYKIGNHLKTLEPFTKVVDLNGKKVLQTVEIDIEERPIKNGKKYVISKVNNVELK